MNLTDLLDEKRIVADLKAGSREDVLREMAATITSQNSKIDLDTLVEKLIERENLSSTGIGEGIAIPHCKDDNLNGIIMAFGRSVKGVDFDSIDKQPAHIFFLLIAPNTQQAAGEHLRVLAKITRVLRSSECREKLLSATDEKEILKLISEEEEKY